MAAGLLAAGVSILSGAAVPRGADLSAAERAVHSLPAWFEPNAGQLDPRVKFASHGTRGTLLVEAGGATLAFPEGALRLTVEGTRGPARLEAEGARPARTNYLLGSRREAWKFDVPQYSRIRWREAYPGIDLAYYFTENRLEYDFLVAPGADPSRIHLRFSGARASRLDPDGTLVFDVGGLDVRQPRPVSYQIVGGRRASVDVRYLAARNGEVRFAVGPYDPSKPLVIDPILHAGYLKGAGNEVVRAIALDKSGDLWVTGSAYGTFDLPAQNDPYQATSKGQRDVFVARFSIKEDGQSVLGYWTYIGGLSNDEASAIAVDATGNVYVAGDTLSSDFPTAGKLVQAAAGGDQDVFVVRLDPSATGSASLVYSTLFGKDKRESVRALAIDNSGIVAIAGMTASDNLPGSDSGVQCCRRGGWEAFVAKINTNPDASQALVYSSLFGGGRTDVATAIALDAQGNIYFTGYTLSEDFPTTGDGYSTSLQAGGDAFFAKFDLSKSGLEALTYATYLGGSDLDYANAMALDASGKVWIAGYTLSQDFPTTSDAYQTAAPGGVDVFLVALDPSRPRGQGLRYSTYLGGSDTDVCYSLARMPDGRIALAGYTMSQDFPGKGSAPDVRSADAFVTVLDPSKSGAAALASTTLVGGAYAETATAVVTDPSGNLYAAGYTISLDLPVTDGSTKLTGPAIPSGFLLKIDPGAAKIPPQ